MQQQKQLSGDSIEVHLENFDQNSLQKQQIQVQEEKKQLNYSLVRKEISKIIYKPEYDDGTIGPVLVRLAWHASGTYDKETNTGGSNGATMRFKAELSDPANAGLNVALQFLEPIKKKFPEISYADLWILASYVAIEKTGRIPFIPGRKDALSETECPPNGRLPDASKDAKHIRDIFNRMGFDDREMVALIGGGHSLGRCHPERSGYEGPWNFMPTRLTNQFFKKLLGFQWAERKWSGPKQYIDQTRCLMMLPADMELRDDSEFRKWSDIYRRDEYLFLVDFATAFKKLTELGFVKQEDQLNKQIDKK